MLATSRLRKKIVRVPGGWVGAREHEGLSCIARSANNNNPMFAGGRVLHLVRRVVARECHQGPSGLRAPRALGALRTRSVFSRPPNPWHPLSWGFSGAIPLRMDHGSPTGSRSSPVGRTAPGRPQAPECAPRQRAQRVFRCLTIRWGRQCGASRGIAVPPSRWGMRRPLVPECTPRPRALGGYGFQGFPWLPYLGLPLNGGPGVHRRVWCTSRGTARTL